MTKTSTKTILTPFLLFVLIVIVIGAAACGPTAGTVATSAGGSESATSSTHAASAREGSSADDTSYTSASTTITISTASMGSGRDKVTYYVADIELTEGSDLESAFANGEYEGQAEDTSTVASANSALVAINGDYYSAREDGIVIRDGVIYRDKPARTGLSNYQDGTMVVYDETTTTAEDLLAEGVRNTYSFGPGLMVDGSVTSGLDTYEAEANPRHPIQGSHPRTGIGAVGTNHFVFVVVDGRSPGYSRGVTLQEFAEIFQGLGCTVAYNLDGGGSSTLYFMGNVVNNPSQRNGERSVSDIIFVD